MRVARVLVDEGEIPRARVQEITGEAATVSAEIIKAGLEEGYFATPSPKGPLRVALPDKVQEFYFPQLYIDLPVEQSATEKLSLFRSAQMRNGLSGRLILFKNNMTTKGAKHAKERRAGSFESHLRVFPS